MSDDEAHAQLHAVCDFCDNIAEYYCTLCKIKLCSPCQDDHLSKKLYQHHEAVPYTSGVGQETATQSECSNHPGERYQLYCEPCEVPVCFRCLVENHRKHEYSSISDAYETIKAKAMSQIEAMSQNIRPRLRKKLEGLSKSQVEILGAIAEIERKMKESAQHIHKEVDDILAENMQEIQKIKDETIMPLLQKEIRKAQEKLNHVNGEISSYDKHLRSADPVDLLKFMMKERDVDSVGVASNHFDAAQLFPSFTPGRISRGSLQYQFGKLVDHTKPLCATECTMNYDVWGLKLRSRNEAWVHGTGSTEFDLLERSGKVVLTVDAGCTLDNYFGKSVTDDGGLVYSDFHNKCIRSLSLRGQVSTLFTTEDYKPRGLCRLMSGELVVGMEGGVIRIYNDDGRVVREVKSDHVNNPNYITINKFTGDICVSESYQKVVGFKKNGEHRFTYAGNDSKSGFYPNDLCSDRQGLLLITDRENHRIHIVDQDGQFIQYLVTKEDGIQDPVSIDIDDHGHAWVGEVWSRKVKIIKYFQ